MLVSPGSRTSRPKAPKQLTKAVRLPLNKELHGFMIRLWRNRITKETVEDLKPQEDLTLRHYDTITA